MNTHDPAAHPAPPPQAAPPLQAAPPPQAQGPGRPAQLDPQGGGGDCGCSGGGGPTGYVYAIGALRTSFPNTSVQEEFNQSAADLQTVVGDSWVTSQVLSQGQNLYLTQDLCWVLQVPGVTGSVAGANLYPPGTNPLTGNLVDAYLIKPRSYVELNELVAATRPTNEPLYVTVIGPRGPVASPEMCDGLQLPIVVANQVYAFTQVSFVNHVLAGIGQSSAVGDSSSSVYQAVSSTFAQLMALTDNAGASAEHRAINYIALRYPDVYVMALDMLGVSGATPPANNNPYQLDAPYVLSGVTAGPAPVQGNRVLVDVQFHYTQRRYRQRVSWSCRVDVTGQFPFLVLPLSRFYAHP